MCRLFADPNSGNCDKVSLIRDLSGRAVPVVGRSIVEGPTQPRRFRPRYPDVRGPFGPVPTVNFDDALAA